MALVSILYDTRFPNNSYENAVVEIAFRLKIVLRFMPRKISNKTTNET